MVYSRNERIFYVPEADLDEVIMSISVSGYGQWKLYRLESLGPFIELTDQADDKLRAFLKQRLSRK